MDYHKCYRYDIRSPLLLPLAGITFIAIILIYIKNPSIALPPSFASNDSFVLVGKIPSQIYFFTTLGLYLLTLFIVLLRSRTKKITTSAERGWILLYAMLLWLTQPMAWQRISSAVVLLIVTLLYNYIYRNYTGQDDIERKKLSPSMTTTIGVVICIITLLKPSAIVFIILIFIENIYFKLVSTKEIIGFVIGFISIIFILTPFFWESLFGYPLLGKEIKLIEYANKSFTQYFSEFTYTFTPYPIWRLKFMGNERIFISYGTLLLSSLIASNVTVIRNNREKKRIRKLSSIDLRLLTPIIVGLLFIPFLYDYFIWVTIPIAVLMAYGNKKNRSNTFSIIFLITLTLIQYLF